MEHIQSNLRHLHCVIFVSKSTNNRERKDLDTQKFLLNTYQNISITILDKNDVLNINLRL